MEKRYQVFVSSTYIDLKEERQSALQTLMAMDCIPAGMELFPAADEEQFQFIKKIIDDSDYYLLIIGGRYGSTTEDGLSYTEKEYDYAVSKGIKVIALLHGEQGNLPVSKSEISPELIEKLEFFRKKVSTNRLIRYWTSPSQLPGEVALSLISAIKMFPATGWVRGGGTNSTELLSEINELHKRNSVLQLELEELKKSKPIVGELELADLQSEIELHGSYSYYQQHTRRYVKQIWDKKISWENLFSCLSPFITELVHDDRVSEFIANELSSFRSGENGITDLIVNQQDLFTVKIQFIALELIDETNAASNYWKLTKLGMQYMLKCRVIKRT